MKSFGMDKPRGLWYKERRMKKGSCYGMLLAVLMLGAVQAEPAPTEPPSPTVWDAEGMYAQARTMLEDHTIQNVSAVPAMLEGCDRAGLVQARLLLLDVYEGTRKGIEADPAKAYELACRMAETPLSPEATQLEREARLEAMYRRALYLERGFGCPVQLEQAYHCMAAAATAGLPKAQVELARYLFKGKGHEPAPQAALYILRHVAYRHPDTPNLFFYLGHMFLNGLGLPNPEPKMAHQFFEFGARMKDAQAINNLASMYELGIGVSRNAGKALRLYKQAAALGCKDASANMQRLAYKTDSKRRQTSTWRQRLGRASLRVVQVLPLSPLLRQWVEAPFLHMAAES